MDGKTALITGATSGIGLVMARALVSAGAHVFVAGRDPVRAERVAADLHREGRGGRSEAFAADLSSQADVRRLAAEIQSRVTRLDLLMNNAGAVFADRKLSVDGIEMTLAVNHLAPFLLTNLLLDQLRAGDASRVVTTASAAHQGARPPFDDMNNAQGRWFGFRAYSETKLMNIMFTYALARRLSGMPVTANAFHPGFVATNFGRSNGGWWNAAFRLGSLFAISPEKGAQTGIFLAMSPEVANVTGGYFAGKKQVKSSPETYDINAQERLWTVSESLTTHKENALR
ncbi:MAG TPA: SDR family oxidoreductase [Ktedonobacterales bacterium]